MQRKRARKRDVTLEAKSEWCNAQGLGYPLLIGRWRKPGVNQDDGEDLYKRKKAKKQILYQSSSEKCSTAGTLILTQRELHKNSKL